MIDSLAPWLEERPLAEVIGPEKADLLQQELGIVTCEELLRHYPFRYEDLHHCHPLKTLRPGMRPVYCKGTIKEIRRLKHGSKAALVATLVEEGATLQLIWFHQLDWFQKKVHPGQNYHLFGKPVRFSGSLSIIHPELAILPNLSAPLPQGWRPIYSTTKRLALRHLDSKGIAKLQRYILYEFLKGQVTENLPPSLLSRLHLLPRADALQAIHSPPNPTRLRQARCRLKFEELFYLQLRLLQAQDNPFDRLPATPYKETALLQQLYKLLPYTLTSAQQQALGEIQQDLGSGFLMNRLLQGDVGSGKTIVALASMLLPCSQGAQAAFMAPTELLATQHYHTLRPYVERLRLSIGLLTGATPTAERRKILQALLEGQLSILIGTHALFQEAVQFQQLGLVVIDEQHRFGVAQRARLHSKGPQRHPPHTLVVTATPIPRTLAMTLYSHLDRSVIHSLPTGRKPIKTVYRLERHRHTLFDFLRHQIEKGHQVYIVHPRIEGSSSLEYKNLLAGYETIHHAFPNCPIGILHGRMKPADKEREMNRFARNETKILVTTTIIEVGMDVPNATVMVIENADKFGLTQLHQLRGRVGRSFHQSYCILMVEGPLEKAAKARLDCMVRTQDGFAIAETDLKLRGPGNLVGVEQSGLFAMKIANLTTDITTLQHAIQSARRLLSKDPSLSEKEHASVKHYLTYLASRIPNFGAIS